MALMTDHPEVEMRERVLLVAERLVRQLGYQKTTVADIAKAMRMSPANVYRFFDSKKAIHEGVARRLMSEVEAAARAIANSAKPPPQRLRDLLTTVHRMNVERYVGDANLHEMVEIAMEESWDVCVAHIERITGMIAEVIGDGRATGEFDAPDVALASSCTCTAMINFFHPQLIATCEDKPGPTLDQMIDFVLAALGVRRSTAAAMHG